MDQRARLLADDVSTEELAGPAIGDELHQPVRAPVDVCALVVARTGRPR